MAQKNPKIDRNLIHRRSLMIVLPFLAPLIYSLFAFHATLIRAKPGGENREVKETLDPFLKAQGIRDDLIFKEKKIPEFCAAVGTNFAKMGHAIIFLAPSFYTVDRQACLWIAKHELSHIKSNDYFLMNGIAAVGSLIAALFRTSEIPGFLVAMAVGMIMKILFGRYREAMADDFAIRHSSVEELRGGKRFFLSLRQTTVEAHRRSRWNRLFISPAGEYRFKYLHPSTGSRLKKIESALGEEGRKAEEIEPLVELISRVKN